MTTNKGGNMNETTKQARFDKLIHYYTVALCLTTQLIDGDLLERKIKVTDDNYESVRRPLLIAVANDLRQAERSTITDEYDALAVATAYFDELQARGNEWEYADLQDLFIKFKTQAQEVIDDNKGNW